MARVARCELPDDALLRVYASSEGCYTDCYVAEVATAVALPDFVATFYTTPLFKAERIILSLFFSRSSTDDEARQIGDGQIDTFAAWRTEQRTGEQLLMCDMSGRTRSWFMVETVLDGTRLYFGSAVVPVLNKKTGQRSLGFVFRALLGFHKLYSRALLSAASSRLSG